jgi:hypothetical protein
MLFLPISRFNLAINDRTLHLFFSFASSNSHLHSCLLYAAIHSFTFILLHAHTCTSTCAENTDRHKREKLTPYACSQSAYCPLLRKASDRMIIASRSFALFVRCFCAFSLSPFPSSLSSILFIRSSVHV